MKEREVFFQGKHRREQDFLTEQDFFLMEERGRGSIFFRENTEESRIFWQSRIFFWWRREERGGFFFRENTEESRIFWRSRIFWWRREFLMGKIYNGGGFLIGEENFWWGKEGAFFRGGVFNWTIKLKFIKLFNIYYNFFY